MYEYACRIPKRLRNACEHLILFYFKIKQNGINKMDDAPAACNAPFRTWGVFQEDPPKP
jgi:hypothetical protein